MLPRSHTSTPNKASPSSHVRKQRACDQCRQRKVRCNGRESADNKCTSCSAAGRECTYTNFRRQVIRPPRISAEYVEELERTIEKLKALLGNVESSPSPIDITSEPSPDSGSTPAAGVPQATTDVITTVLRSVNDLSNASSPALSDDDDDVFFPVRGRENEGVVLGMSSNIHLAKAIMDMKLKENSNFSSSLPSLEPEVWEPHDLYGEVYMGPTNFPDDATLNHLVGTYFDCVNIFWPCLHRPTFERQIAEGKHLTDVVVETKVLLVIAIAAQYSTKYELYWNGVNPQGSLAWEWFRRAHALRRRMLVVLPSVSLDQLQMGFLAVSFLSGYQNAQACWILCGLGLRGIQFSGAHKRSRYARSPPIESEMSKRAVWLYTVIDIFMSASFGSHPMHVLIDLAPLAECDDEYFFDGISAEDSFRQPPEKPSKVAFFNRLIPLSRILGILLSTIYSAKYMKTYMAVNVSEFNNHLVRELDSAMNVWIEAMPAHLKWDSKHEDDAFFAQSALLHCLFYLVQILIHQPFISLAAKSTEDSSLPSMSICLNAARACCRIAEAHLKRTGVTLPVFQFTVFTSALILLTSIYRKKKLGVSANSEQEMADIKRCLAVIESSGDRWITSSRMSQLLRELASIAPDLTPQSSQATRENISGMEGINPDTILCQSWSSACEQGGWSVFSDMTGMGDLNPQGGYDANNPPMPDATFGPGIAYQTTWPDAYMQPLDEIGEILPGMSHRMDSMFSRHM